MLKPWPESSSKAPTTEICFPLALPEMAQLAHHSCTAPVLNPTATSEQSPRWNAYAIAALTILAPVLGGSTKLWAQAVIILGTGALFLLSPPRKSLGTLPTLMFVAVGVAALIAFLPAHWFPSPQWRATLANLGVQMPRTRSPQPWLTVESSCLLWLGLAWAYYLFAFAWNQDLREKVWDTFCLAIIGLAATLTFAFVINKHVPLWPEVRGFGFFPNRNQTSNVLGLGGVMIYANAFQHLQRSRNVGWVWLVSLAVVCWALILNYSRAGIILFFGGALIWNAWWWIRSKEGTRRALAFAPLGLLFVLLIMAGGETFLRFSKESADLLTLRNARMSIFRDAFQLLQQSPWLGTGLGNFRALFSSHRHFSFNTNEAIHPESDWLWLGVEMGLLVPLILLTLFGWWVRSCFPFERGTWRLMRMAALICGCAFLVHGFFDVSGHRMGALWPALFLASTAMHPQVRRPDGLVPSRDRHLPARVIPIVFRSLGIFLSAAGLWWIASIAGAKTLPTTASLDRLEERAEAASQDEDHQSMLERISEALKIAPLNWELYFKRGFAEAALHHPRAETLRDFAVARYLLPNWPDLYLKEGQVWAGVGEPEFAFDVWREGMQRLPQAATELYHQIFVMIKSNPGLVDRWRQLGESNKECLLIFFGSADRIGFEIEIERLLSEDRQLRSFTPKELTVLFRTWYEKGDKLWLVQTLQAHPEWQKIAWRELARVYGDYQDYRQAYKTAQQFLQPPELPQAGSQEPLEGLRARFLVSRNDLGDGLALYFAQIREGQVDEALRTVRELSALPGSPKYLFFLEAQLWAQKELWKEAWEALKLSLPGSSDHAQD